MLLTTQLGEEAKELVAALQPMLLTLAKDPSIRVAERTMVCAGYFLLSLSLCVCRLVGGCVSCPTNSLLVFGAVCVTQVKCV